MSRPGAAVAAALVLWCATAASAHQPARVVVVAPRPGATVKGTTVDVVLEGTGGQAAATFQLLLDGAEVDVNGVVRGSLFTTLRLGPGERQTFRIRLPKSGVHELRIVPNHDTDSAAPVTVVRFRTVGPSTTAPALVAEALLIAVGAGHGVVARRAAG